MAATLTDVRARAAAIQALALDVDGTLTDGHIYIGPQGEAMKAFSVRDGFGLTLLREAGLRLAIITARRSAIVEHRAAELGITTVIQGARDKLAALDSLCAEFGLARDQVGFAGDDWTDLRDDGRRIRCRSGRCRTGGSCPRALGINPPRRRRGDS